MVVQSDFTEGDIFYFPYENKYHVCKLLVFEKAFSCYHILSYDPLDTIPDEASIDTLNIRMYHSPIDKNGFPGARLISNQKITAGELIGYHEYLKHTKGIDACIALANEYYRTAFQLTDLSKHEDAIDFYSRAIDLIPEFFEAIDNRAFCKMDLARWTEAIEDFRLSLQINPISLLAEFSIGECYLKMKNFPEAKKQFEKALVIDPNHQLTKDFLNWVNELMK